VAARGPELDPPSPIVLAWHLNPEFDFDPDPKKATEVEVTFSAEENGTRVTLIHRASRSTATPARACPRRSAGTAAGGTCWQLYRDAA
jgi:hypothetical protein